MTGREPENDSPDSSADESGKDNDLSIPEALTSDWILEAAPVGVVSLDGELIINWLNAAAATLLEATQGTAMSDCVHPDSLGRFETLIDAAGQSIELQLRGPTGSRMASAISETGPDGERIIFLTDVSEKIALGRQLRASQEPGKKLLQQLNNANSAMMGYAELIDVMLDEDEMLGGERLTVVKRYHKELRRSQQTIDRLVKVARHGGKRPDSGAVPMNRQHVVVIDDEPAIADYLTELMRGLQHRVTTFNDPTEAAAFCRDNAAVIDLVLTDLTMPNMNGVELAARIHEVRSELPVLVCAEEELKIPEDQQLYHCPKPLDINDLIQIVTELV